MNCDLISPKLAFNFNSLPSLPNVSSFNSNLIMLMKQQGSSTSTSITAGGTCGHCGLKERRFLHHVHHRGIFRRLCTNCLLRLHPHSFCPTCFVVYESPTTLIPLPSNDAVSCFKCYSSSHISCVGPAPNKPYNCPLCSNPNSPIFVVKDSKDQEGCKEIDKKAARVLLAAAKIAAGTMNKAAAAAKVEAERRAKEAAISRQRAKEAMEHLACTEATEKSKKDLGSGNYRNAIASSIVGNVGEKNLFGDRNRMDRLDNSSAVLAAFNVVELKEKARLERVKSEIGVLGVNGDLKAMKIEEKVQNNGAGDEKEKYGEHLNNSSAQTESVSSGLLPVLEVEPVAVLNGEQPQYMHNNHARDGNVGSQQ